MTTTWKLTAHAPRAAVEAALAAHDAAPEWDADIVVAGSEIAEDRPEAWRLDVWLPREPTGADRAAVAGLFGAAPPVLEAEALPETDWVAESQAGMPPILDGRFRVRTPDHPPEPRVGRIELVIPASRAFGTGQHETTAGCLEMLTRIADLGSEVTSLIDVGTGTGLLAFAARALWPDARATASDLDPVCEDVVRENAAINGVPLGEGDIEESGSLALVIADGLDHPALRARAPFDLLIANILAAPLIDLAPSFAKALAQAGNVVLAGLLASQADAVRGAYEHAGLEQVERIDRGDWAILWLRRRSAS